MSPETLPELDKRGPNINVVAAISPQLFAMQDDAYKQSVASEADWRDSMCVTKASTKLTREAQHWLEEAAGTKGHSLPFARREVRKRVGSPSRPGA